MRCGSEALDDFEVTLEFPVRSPRPATAAIPIHGSRREVIDEGVAQPVARDARFAGNCSGFDQRTRRAGNVLAPLIGAGDRRRGWQALLDTVQTGGDQCSGGKAKVDIGAGAACLRRVASANPR